MMYCPISSANLLISRYYLLYIPSRNHSDSTWDFCLHSFANNGRFMCAMHGNNTYYFVHLFRGYENE